MTNESDFLFAGLKVLDVGTWIASPLAATILGDFGATVIKVEAPKGGDPYRAMAALPIMPKTPVNFGWLLGSHNKRSITLNLKSEEGRDVLRKLVADCDVYVTNQPLPMRRALGLTYEDLAPLNERMIFASVTAYGEKGPDADLEAFDTVAWWARSGLMDHVRAPGALPAGTIAHAMGDHPTAVTLYAAIVTALLRRERTGKGSMVHTSLLANGVWSNAILGQAAMVGATFSDPKHTPLAPNDLLFETSDGRFVKPFMLRNQKEIDRLLVTAGLEWAIADPRFTDAQTRLTNLPVLSDLLTEAFLKRTAAEWVEIFRLAGTPLVLAARTADLPNDPQLIANNMVAPPTDPSVPAKLVINHPLNIDGLARVGTRHPPELGEHTREILSGLGYSEADISGLSDRDVT